MAHILVQAIISARLDLRMAIKSVIKVTYHLRFFNNKYSRLLNVTGIECYIEDYQVTLPRKKYNTQKNGPVPILHPRPSKLSQLPKSKGIFEI